VAIGRRPLLKDIHVYTAVAWILALALVVLLGDRRRLRATLRELDAFDEDDMLWLRRYDRPQGRFNAGQKINAALTAAFALLFVVSGSLLWLGERDHRFQFASTILLHDWLTFFSLVLLLGHLYLALIYPATRHALRGMTVGTVRRDWAERHHPKWVREQE
jgi:formate dehydrogenase subunit gamma